jgi:hypothetical protein
MAMVRCSADEHYYDDTKHSSCPYCKKAPVNDAKTQVIKSAPKEEPKQESKPKASSTPSKGPKTQFAWGSKKKETKKADVSPVVGWLVIIKGNAKGEDFRLIPGMNTIGRDGSNAVSVESDETISREKHAVIIFDYKNRLFFLQHGEGNNLTYLNDSVVLQPSKLKSGDHITLGDTTFMFVPFCDENCPWEL